MNRAIIIAGMKENTAPQVAEIFARSDATSLPTDVGAPGSASGQRRVERIDPVHQGDLRSLRPNPAVTRRSPGGHPAPRDDALPGVQGW
jgi:hypothetical protein